MERYSDRAIELLNELHTERLDYGSEYVPLIDAAERLAAYEDTELEPAEIECVLDGYGRGHTLRATCAERLSIIRDIPTEQLRGLAGLLRSCTIAWPKWISADQAMPPQDGVYLVCTRKGAVTTAHFYPAHQFSNGVYKPAEWQGNRDVAYWMPLPEPPELQPPEGAVRIAKLGRKRIWVDDNDQFVSEVD